MRLRQLEYFIAICESGSFTGAAEQLLVAQPSLSQQIRSLEKELGAELVERGRHGVTPTAAGRVFLTYARAAIQTVEAGRDAVSNLTTGGEGELHVCTIRSVASGVLPGCIVEWYRRYPATVLHLHDYSHRKDLQTALREGHGDLAIGPRPDVWFGAVVSLGFEPMMIAGRAPFASAVACSEELRAAKWIHFEPEQGMSEVLDWAVRALDVEPVVVSRVGQVAAALQLAVAGIGLTMIPANAVPDGWCHHVRRSDPPIFRELVAYTRGPIDALTARFVELLGNSTPPLILGKDLPPGALTC